MRNDNYLYKELSDVPQVPQDAFKNIEKRIYAHSGRRKIFFSLAASLLLMLGGLTFVTLNSQMSKSTVLAAEVTEELQLARDFFNSDETQITNDEFALLTDINDE